MENSNKKTVNLEDGKSNKDFKYIEQAKHIHENDKILSRNIVHVHENDKILSGNIVHINENNNDEHEEGHTHFHEDQHLHNHNHKHHHQNTKAVLNRLSKATGHLQSVKRMVENGRDCSEVLIQLAAVIAALNSTGRVILEDHINNCIVDAVESGDKKAIEDLNKVIGKFIK